MSGPSGLWQRALRRPRAALLAGPAVFAVVYAAGLLAGLRLDIARDSMMQFVGPSELAAASYADLIQVHMQPAGFNAWLKAYDSLGDATQVAWMITLLVGTLVALWMVGDIVWQLSANLALALGAGLLAALVPGTLYYSLWVFYTQPAAILVTTMIWGLTVGLVTRRPWALGASVAAVLPLFLIRTTYAWPVVIVWAGLVWWLGRDVLRAAGRPSRVLFGLVTVLVIGIAVGIQLVSFRAFGIATQSSWSYENASKALMTQMPMDVRLAAAQGDPCLEQVVKVGVFRPISEYPACATEGPLPEGYAAGPLLDSLTWENGAPNMNQVGRIALAEQWKAFAGNAIAADPTLIARIPFPNFTVKERGTLVRFVWPSAWYWIIDTNVAKGGLVASAWLVLFSWVPVVGLAGILLALAVNVRRWAVAGASRVAFVTGSWTVAVLTLAYLLLETGENERFRAEIDWVIIALGSVAWWGLRRLWRERRGARAHATDSPSTDDASPPVEVIPSE